ncbi:serine protease FAM111A isoform X2 [Carettochelys insculpta]|uniref:serine protease FAM111A isoform X2 n=1 Tax=Carettochelys insculpta TaxID=44489 RepID=UPI003EBC33FA
MPRPSRDALLAPPFALFPSGFPYTADRNVRRPGTSQSAGSERGSRAHRIGCPLPAPPLAGRGPRGVAAESAGSVTKKNGSGSNPSTAKRRRTSTGASAVKDIGNTPVSAEKPEIQDPQADDNEEREFTVSLGKTGGEYVVKGKGRDTIYAALMALKNIQMHIKKQKGKELYLQGKREIKAFVNVGMPLKCLPKKSHFEMKFYKVKRDQEGGEQGYRQLDSTGTEFVVFYVAPNGKKGPGGAQGQKIMWCQELTKQRCKICVFAPKGETIKEALCKDGRFLPLLKEKEWHLVENSESLQYTHYSVDNLASQSFEVEIQTENAAKAKNDQQGGAIRTEQEDAFCRFKLAVLAQYPELREQSELIKEFFEQEVKKSRTHMKAVLELHRKKFSKEAKNSTPVRVHKLLAKLSNAIGYVEWNYNGNEGCATCFVLCEGYILTCGHVVSDVAGLGVEVLRSGKGVQCWAEVSQSVRVAFSYESTHPKEDDWFYIEPRLVVLDQPLDYAVLELKERSTGFPDGLAKYIASPPCRGLIYIIGRPDGKEKSTDGCSIVTPLERGWACTERLQRGQVESHNSTSCGVFSESRNSRCIHMFTQRSFEGVIDDPHKVTYDTSFFCGSSGSPVFDASGHLIAMHTAGYLYRRGNQEHSIIEWGHSMEAILSDIKKKNPGLYESVLGHRVEGTEAPSGGPEDTAEAPYDNCKGATCAEISDVTMESDSDVENNDYVGDSIPFPRPAA